MTKAQLREHLLNAPPGTTPGGIVQALRARGVELEGDPMPVQQAPQNPFNPFAGKQPEGGSMFGNIKSSIENRGNNIAQLAEDYGTGKQGFGSTVLQTTGELTGGVNDVFAEPVKQVTTPVVEIFNSWAQAHPKAASAIGSTMNSLKQSLIQLATGITPENQDQISEVFTQATAQLAKDHPEASRNIAALGEIAKFAGNVKGAEQIGNQLGLGKNIDMAAIKEANAYAKEGLSNPGQMTDMRGNPIEPPAKANPARSVMPRMTPAMKQEKIMSGEVEPGGYLKPDKYLAGKKEETIFNSVKDIEGFSPKNSATKNSLALVKGLKTEGSALGKELDVFDRTQKIGLSPSQYQATVRDGVKAYTENALATEGSIFPKESVAKAQFSEIENVWNQIVAKNPPSGLKDVWVKNLQAFDDRLVELYGTKIFNGATEAPRSAAVRAIRRAAQQFIQDTAQQAGANFKPQVTRMSHIYQALENLTDIASHGPSTGLGRQLQTPIGKVVKSIAKPLGIGEAVNLLNH